MSIVCSYGPLVGCGVCEAGDGAGFGAVGLHGSSVASDVWCGGDCPVDECSFRVLNGNT